MASLLSSPWNRGLAHSEIAFFSEKYLCQVAKVAFKFNSNLKKLTL